MPSDMPRQHRDDTHWCVGVFCSKLENQALSASSLLRLLFLGPQVFFVTCMGGCNKARKKATHIHKMSPSAF